jgi:hypothetical protein
MLKSNPICHLGIISFVTLALSAYSVFITRKPSAIIIIIAVFSTWGVLKLIKKEITSYRQILDLIKTKESSPKTSDSYSVPDALCDIDSLVS